MQLLGSRCDVPKLKSEAKIIFNHVKNFGSNKQFSRSMLFSLKHELGIRNILHIAQISIALQICNAESE